MISTAIRPSDRSFGPHATAPSVILARVAMIGAAYLVGMHLAVAMSGPAPENVGADAPPAPACVGCHHGPDEEAPPPDGGLAGPERDALSRFGRSGQGGVR